MSFNLSSQVVAKTSLSLSFDEETTVDTSEQGFANKKILPNLKQHVQHSKLQSPQDQENDHTKSISSVGLIKGKTLVAKSNREVKSAGTPQNSPSREPLRPILAPNHTHSRVMKQRETHPSLPQKRHLSQGLVQSVSTQGVASALHHKNQRPQHALAKVTSAKSKRDGKQVFLEQVDVVHGTEVGKDNHRQNTNLVMVAKPQGSKIADHEKLHSFTGQGEVSSKHKVEGNKGKPFDQRQSIRSADNSNNTKLVNLIPKSCLETVYEGETPDGTLNQSKDETQLEIQIIGENLSTNNEVHWKVNATVILDQDEETVQGNVQKQRSSKEKGFYVHSPDSREHIFEEFTPGSVVSENVPLQSQGKERLTPKANGEDNDIQKHQQLFQEDAQVAQNVTAMTRKESSTSAKGSTLPGPYQLLIRQEAQLRELQEQVHN